MILNRLDKWLLGALSAAAMVATLLTWQDTRSDRDDAVGLSLPTAATRPVQAPTGPKLGAFPMPPDEVPLTEQVLRLMATQDPAKIYLAYRLLSGCDEFNKEHDRLTFDEAELKNAKPGYVPGFRGMNEREKLHDAKLCRGMTERERLSRLDYLAIAAKAGVPGSAVAFVKEGPFGDPSALKTRPSDPLVQEWKALAKAQLISAAETGADTEAISDLAAENYNGSELFEKNLLLAYRYNIASGLIYREMYGPEVMLSKVFAKDSERMAAMGKDFSVEERAAELVAAQRIVDNAREQRKRSGDSKNKGQQ